jgi:hypothetical protein
VDAVFAHRRIEIQRQSDVDTAGSQIGDALGRVDRQVMSTTSIRLKRLAGTACLFSSAFPATHWHQFERALKIQLANTDLVQLRLDKPARYTHPPRKLTGCA